MCLLYYLLSVLAVFDNVAMLIVCSYHVCSYVFQSESTLYSVFLRTKWLWVGVQLQSLNVTICLVDFLPWPINNYVNFIYTTYEIMETFEAVVDISTANIGTNI